MNQTNLYYVCHQLLELDWVPNITSQAIKVFDECESKLEMMCILGAIHFIETAGCEAWNHDEFVVKRCTVKYQNKKYPSLLLDGSGGIYPAWANYCRWGPETVIFTPQVEFGPHYHHDLGIFYNECESQKNIPLQYAVEFDGYNTHKNRREKDTFRDSLVNYTVVRVREEVDSPKKWFKIIMEKDDDDLQY